MLVVVGGHTRNIGKTSVVAGLIGVETCEGLSAELAAHSVAER